MRFRKLPMVRLIRRRIVKTRLAKSRSRRFHEGLRQILELKGQYGEIMSEWLGHRDETARHEASEILQKIYKLIRKLSRNNHKRELYAFLKAQRIPGWRQAFPADSSRRR